VKTRCNFSVLEIREISCSFLDNPCYYGSWGSVIGSTLFMFYMHFKCPASETLWLSRGKFQACRDEDNVYLPSVYKKKYLYVLHTTLLDPKLPTQRIIHVRTNLWWVAESFMNCAKRSVGPWCMLYGREFSVAQEVWCQVWAVKKRVMCCCHLNNFQII